MVETKPLAFISYETTEARAYATRAKQVFEQCGFRAWVWHSDRGQTGYVQAEMAANIDDCDYFVHICTEGSNGSKGQCYEREMAWACEKVPPVILAFDPSFIPLEWRPYIYNLVAPRNFDKVCSEVASKLARQQRLGTRVAACRREGEALEPTR